MIIIHCSCVAYPWHKNTTVAVFAQKTLSSCTRVRCFKPRKMPASLLSINVSYDSTRIYTSCMQPLQQVLAHAQGMQMEAIEATLWKPHLVWAKQHLTSE